MEQQHSAFIHSPDLERYPYPPECPFNTSRAGKARRILTSMGMLTGRGKSLVAPEPTTRQSIERYHTPRYLDVLSEAAQGRMGVEGLQMGLGTSDCPVFSGMYDYAVLACAATLTGCRLLAEGEARVAFNPSGGYHHAMASRAAGFCYINDAALACLDLAGRGMRVLYLDVDAHHGDGVEAAAYSRNDIMTLSFHESGHTLFPGTGFEKDIGTGPGTGYAVNVPLPTGTYDRAFLKAFEALALPLIDAYNPDILVMELGLDGLSGDPLAHLSLTNNVYVEVIERVLGFGKPVLAVGGGGYNVENTARGWALCWAVLCGEVADEGIGLGGVMLESVDWLGGLRDRVLAVDDEQKSRVDAAIEATIAAVKANVFTYHGL
ncbi:MAG: acetoin utilization protein AcuC [Planctomycetes bacterium]|nr:acetoin utilization protein AcuC [Planctomycetota bacterium]